MKYTTIKDYPNNRFKAAVGISRETFDTMVEVLQKAYIKRHSKHNGRHRQLGVEDMLLATLEYLYEYRTFECIGASYGMTRQGIHKVIKWVEDELIACGLFSLPGKKVLSSDTEIEVILVDTTETPINRPQRNQKHYYSGKKTAYAEDPSGGR